ncbi:hypothetical protein, partial [Paraburkholderia azotifigens]|uniref:hypothetical protein n=1 Tax=Paraburkholderia azotifigens TaxID=2057004 RepID=UPI003181E6CD
MFVFGVRDCWKGSVYQFLASVAILFTFLVEYLERSVLNVVQRESCPIHFAVAVVIPPTSN